MLLTAVENRPSLRRKFYEGDNSEMNQKQKKVKSESDLNSIDLQLRTQAWGEIYFKETI